MYCPLSGNPGEGRFLRRGEPMARYSHLSFFAVLSFLRRREPMVRYSHRLFFEALSFFDGWLRDSVAPLHHEAQFAAGCNLLVRQEIAAQAFAVQVDGLNAAVDRVESFGHYGESALVR